MVFMRRRGYSNTWKIRLYRYGLIWKTLEVKRGQSVTLGACDRAYSDDTFYGWSTAYNSVTRTYTSVSNITPTADINLYAVFSYTVREIGTKNSLQSAYGLDIYDENTTIEVNGYLNLTCYAYVNNDRIDGKFASSNTTSSGVYISGAVVKVNGTVVGGEQAAINKYVTAGDVVNVWIKGISNTYVSGSFNVIGTYPAYVTSVKYRVVSHS